MYGGDATSAITAKWMKTIKFERIFENYNFAGVSFNSDGTKVVATTESCEGLFVFSTNTGEI